MSKVCKKRVHGNGETTLPWALKKCPRSLYFTLLQWNYIIYFHIGGYFFNNFLHQFFEKNAYKFERNCKSARFVCFHPWLCRRLNFSLIARYSWKFTRCSLLVVKSTVTRCKICSLRKITRYSLQKLLVAKNHSLLVAKFTRYPLQKLLVAKNHLLLVAKFARCLLQKWSHFL